MAIKKILLFPFALVLLEIVTYLSNDMYLPGLPLLVKSFAISDAQGQSTLTWWFVGAVSVQLILGPLSDHFGRKSVLFIGGILFILSSIVCASTHNFLLFVMGRFIEGSCVCFVTVVGYASLHESFDQKQAIKFLALMGSITVLAPAFGPLLGSVVLEFLSWRWIFIFLIIYSVISLMVLMYFMPETLPKDKRHPIALKITLTSYKKIITNKLFLSYSVILGLNFCGFITWIVAGPFIVMEQFHLSSFVFGIFQAIIFLFYIAANYSLKYLMEKFTLQVLIRLGIFIALLGGIMAFFLAWFFPEFLIGMIISYCVYGIGSALEFAILNRMAVESSQEPMGARMAMFSTFLMAFAALGTILVSVFYNGTLFSLGAILLILMLSTVILEWIRK